MKTAGIISEYNPFHNGHKYHIEETKRLTGADSVVCVMSGNFVQRGETAVFSKWARAEAAVENGADLVLELPTVWSVARAQDFASGAVCLLHSLGCVDVISFGSESGNKDELVAAAESLNDERVITAMQKNLNSGMSFASARAEAVREIFGDSFYEILNEPNNILGTEYIIANNKNPERKAEIFTVKRKAAAHDSSQKSENIASASEIRRMILSGENFTDFVPENAAEIYKAEIKNGTAPADYSKLETSVLCRMRQLTAQELKEVPDVSEGIENRIISAAAKAKSLDELFTLAKTKRYSHARIRRIVLSAFLGITKETPALPPYIKVLAMNEKGREILKSAKEKSSLPIITRSADCENLPEEAKKLYEAESVFTDIFSLASPEIQPCGREKTARVIVK